MKFSKNNLKKDIKDFKKMDETEVNVPKSNLIKIIGFGNIFMGDDAIGVRVIEELQRQQIFKDNENIEILDGGTSGIDLMFMLQNAAKAIIIDAVDAGQEVAQIVVFSPHEITEFKKKLFKSFSLHDIDLSEAFELVRTLNLPVDIKIIGIKPIKIGYSDKLSPEIEESIPEIIVKVIEEVSK
jgi:hydrogenase maturation protease